MRKVVVNEANPDISLLQEAASILKEGGVVALPTETVYGLGAASDNKKAIEKLFKIKRRPKDKPFTLCFADVNDVWEMFGVMPPFVYRIMEAFWPGPLTIISYNKNYDKKIGVRVSSNAILQGIIREINTPLCLPSANISGEREATTADEVVKIFGNSVDLVIDGGVSYFSKPSTIIDVTYHPFKILREGVIPANDLMEVFFKKRIVFVCTGNTCRSAMAEYILKNILSKNNPFAYQRYEIISRGVVFLDNQPPAKEVLNLLKEKENVDATGHRSHRISRKTILSSDLIIVMEEMHREHILKIEPTAEARIFPLKKFLPPHLEKDIPDPIGKPYDFYEDVYYLLRTALEELAGWLS